MRNIILVSLFSLVSTALLGQVLTQVVRGTILDSDSRLPLVGATVSLLDVQPLTGTSTDEYGRFRFEGIPVGRVSLRLQYVGYETKTIADVIVSSGKEVVLEVSMEESVFTIGAATIVASKNANKGDALNEMALASTQSISPEQTKRYAGGFNDPSRILSNVAGVTNSQNGENDIIVRGNSPKYIQWRLEGVEISNPTHFGDQNGAKGGISALNNDLLSTSDFHTGAFAPEFGNVLSGVYDVKLRKGNDEQFEAAFGFGLLGTDATIEGPFKKGYGGSYLLNYRYSAIGLVSDLGLIDIDGVLNYQDMAFKVVLPTKHLGTFSAFGLGGLSGFSIDDVDPMIQSAPGQNNGSENLIEDYDKDNLLFNTGLNHMVSLSNKSFLRTTISYSTTSIKEDVFQSYAENEPKVNSFTGDLQRSNMGISVKYNQKINSRTKLQIGSRFTRFDYAYKQGQLAGAAGNQSLVNFDENVGTINNYVGLKSKVASNMNFVYGLHNMNVLLNSKSTVEPRLAWQMKMSNKQSLSAGYGMHSSMESIHNYYAQTEVQGQIIEPNLDLDLLKAHHFVLGYEKRLSNLLLAKVQLYFQALYNLPVENIDTSYYATVNESSDFRYTDLVNEGKGANYGVELTLERFYDDDFYFLLNGSLYQSKYTPLDGKERNTLYNGNYLVNLLVGRERSGLGKKNNKTLAVNARAFFGGGQKHVPLLRDAQGGLAVEPANGNFYDYNKAYESSLGDVFQLDITTSYKINQKKATHELFLSIINATNTQARISEFYDESQEGSVGYISQFGTFPNLAYRVYF